MKLSKIINFGTSPDNLKVGADKVNAFMDETNLEISRLTSENGIKPFQIESSMESVNVLNNSALIKGQFATNSSGKVGFVDSVNFAVLKTPIAVKPGDIIRQNYATGFAYVIADAAGKTFAQSPSISGVISSEYTIPANGYFIYVNTPINYTDSVMLTINTPMPSEFQPYPIKKSLDWLELTSDSVGLEELSATAATINILNLKKMSDGFLYTDESGKVAQVSGSNWLSMVKDVKAGDSVYHKNLKMNAIFIADSAGTILYRGAYGTTPSSGFFSVPSGGTKLYVNLLKAEADSMMVSINEPLPEVYISGSPTKVVEWIRLGDGAVTDSNLDPTLLSKINSSSSVSRWAGAQGVIAGDSIVDLSGDTLADEVLIGYDGILKRDMQINLINIGRSGKAMADTDRGDSAVNATLTSPIDWMSQELYICNAGTNDFKLNVPVGELNPFGSAFDRTTYIGAYQTAIEYVLGKNPNVQLVLLTPLQRNNDGYSTATTNTAGHMLKDYVEAAKKVGEMYSAQVIDLYSKSGITEINLSSFTSDGLHLNNAGYEKVTAYIMSALD